MNGRDRGVDALRAVAIAGVVLGHWLVTALVPAPGGSLGQSSPLSTLGWLAPASWLLQALGLFFFAAGYAGQRSRAAAAARGTGYAVWLRDHLLRLAGPVAGFVGLWVLALAVGALLGAPAGTLRTAATLATSPLWFLAAYAVLTALAGPLTTALRRRHGTAAVAAAAAGVVAAADLGAGATPLTVVAAWLVPYALGAALAAGRLGAAPAQRRLGWSLAVGGALTAAALVLLAGYPGSAVGVPGDARSNLNPPSLAAVSLAVAQAGFALLARPALAGLLARRPRAAARVAFLNAAAMGIYLWHQTALVSVTMAAAWLSGGRPVAGLHTPPDAAWLAARAGWLPVFAAVLAALVATHRRGARRRTAGRGGRPDAVVGRRSGDAYRPLGHLRQRGTSGVR
jgi:peptidoglycan/LPS O-acetylase OafA/YrhL